MYFLRWIANEHPPWVAYHVLMSRRLTDLEKHPGVRLVGLGETWGFLMANCMLKVAKPEAEKSCRTAQLCGGMEDVIEVGIHMMRLLWK